VLPAEQDNRAAPRASRSADSSATPTCGVADNGSCGATQRIKFDLGEPFEAWAFYNFCPDPQPCLRVLTTYISISVGRCEKPRGSGTKLEQGSRCARGPDIELWLSSFGR
jgi:hypothetical protein